MRKTRSKKSKGGRAGAALAVSAGVAALSAAAYLLFGPRGKQNRRELRGWVVKMKGEMIERFEQVENLTEPVYQRIVKEVSEKYAKQKAVNKQELSAIVADMKKHWKHIARSQPKHRSASRKHSGRTTTRRKGK